MGMREREAVSVASIRGAVCLVVAGGCTTVWYEGSRRPDREVAAVEAASTEIERLDGREAPFSAGKFLVLPGVHSVTVALRNTVQAAPVLVPRSSIFMISDGPVTVCFSANAGRTYWTVPVLRPGGKWFPAVIDSVTKVPVMVECQAEEEP